MNFGKRKPPSIWTDPPEPEPVAQIAPVELVEVKPIIEEVTLKVTQEELDQYRAFICGSCGSITGGEAAGPRAVKLVCTQCTSNTLKPLFSPAAELAAKKYGLDINGLRKGWTQEVGTRIFNRRASKRKIHLVVGSILGLWAWAVALVFHPTFVTVLSVSAIVGGIVWRIKKKTN